MSRSLSACYISTNAKINDKLTIRSTVQLIAPRFFPRVLPGLFVFQHGLHNGSVILLGWFYSALTKNSCHLNTFFFPRRITRIRQGTNPTVYPTLAQSKSTNVPWQNHGFCSVANEFAWPTDFDRNRSNYLLKMYLFQAGGFVSFCANLATASAANLLQLGMQTAGCPNTFIHTKKITTCMRYSDFCLDFASQRVPEHWQGEQVQGTHAQRNANCPWTERKPVALPRKWYDILSAPRFHWSDLNMCGTKKRKNLLMGSAGATFNTAKYVNLGAYWHDAIKCWMQIATPCPSCMHCSHCFICKKKLRH